MTPSRRHSARGPSRRVSAAHVWPIGVAVLVAGVVVLGGLALFRQIAATPAAGAKYAAPAGLGSGQVEDERLDLPAARSAETAPAPLDLPGAITAARPHMTDTIDRLDEGAARLALWASEHLTWDELAKLPETSPALYRKDPAEERGKRLCGRGRIEEVRAERNLARRLQSDHALPLPAPTVVPSAEASESVGLPGEVALTSRWDLPGGKVFFAVIDTAGPEAKIQRDDQERPLVLSVIAAGSTGELVDGDQVRVCGVLTGVNLIKRSAGSDTLAHRIVGLFDLPENHSQR